MQEAYIQGVSTRRADNLVRALVMEGISKSQVSRMCQELDEEVEGFRTRELEGPYPYLWLDATFVKVREQGRVVSQAVVIAIGVKASGEREVLGLDVGPSEDGAFWLQFLRGLVARGLKGVKLAISDAHQGLKGAIEAVLQGASWQRGRVHFIRNALALVPKTAASMVAATIRTVFVQPDAASAREQWQRVIDNLGPNFPAPGPAAGGGRGRRPGLPGLPVGTLATDLVQQSSGACEPRSKEENRRGGDLPKPCLGNTARGDGAGGAAR